MPSSELIDIMVDSYHVPIMCPPAEVGPQLLSPTGVDTASTGAHTARQVQQQAEHQVQQQQGAHAQDNLSSRLGRYVLAPLQALVSGGGGSGRQAAPSSPQPAASPPSALACAGGGSTMRRRHAYSADANDRSNAVGAALAAAPAPMAAPVAPAARRHTMGDELVGRCSPSSSATTAAGKRASPQPGGSSSGGGGADPEETRRAAAAVFGESWQAKRARLQAASSRGHEPGWQLCPVIVKSGDDCRQEVLALQLIGALAGVWAGV